MIELKSITELDEAFSRSSTRPVLIFKHSRICPASANALDEFRDALGRLDFDHGLIVVQSSREISAEVASRTGVQHQSPQALLLHEGQVVWHASHSEITAAVLERELAARQS
jgi:bacillithiol system protein YtxJ